MQHLIGNVALTGGTGFIGRHLVDALLRDGWRVKALTRRDNALPDRDNLTSVAGALEDPSSLRELVRDADAVIHLGGRITGRNLAEFESANVTGTENLVRAAADRSDPPRLIYVSSIAAREPHLSSYAATKREGEQRLQELGGTLRWQIIRPPVVYGPGDKQTLRLFQQFKRGIAVKPATNGRFSMIFVEDLVSAIQYMVGDFDRYSAIFELDDGHANGYSWDDVIDEASRKFDRPIRKFSAPTTLLHFIAASASGFAAVAGRTPILSRDKINEFTHPDWVATTQLLNNTTKWKAKINLRDGISATIDWYVSQGWL